MPQEQQPRTGEAHAETLRELGAGLRALAADSDAPPSARAQRLAAIEGALLDFTTRLAHEDPGFVGERGLPALSWAAEWRDQVVEHGLGAQGEAAETLVERLLQDDADGWSRSAAEAAAAGDATRCFEALLDASLLDREVVARRRDASLPPPLRDRREPLRQAFLGAVERERPTTAQLQAWAVHLADAADVALTAIDDLGSERAALHLEVMADDLAWHLAHVPVLGAERRRLRRKLRRLRRERQERALQGRLEARFGRRFVYHFDRLVVWLIFFVLAALVVETVFDLPLGVRIGLAVADTFACVVFLLEFFVKLWMVRGHGSWFLRHVVIDFLPSIPVGLIMLSMGLYDVQALKGDRNRYLRALRLLRIFRLTRYARAFGFLARGFDRLARRYGHLLNHNIVLYPNRAERAAAAREQESLAARVWKLRSRLNDAWRDLLQGSPQAARPGLAATRTTALEVARGRRLTARTARAADAAAVNVRDIPAEQMLRRLDEVTPEQLEADLGADFVSRAARAVRAFARAPLRWLPIVRRYVPRVAPHMTDAEVAAAGAHALAAELGRHHARWFWVADLYGTVTPSEFVDRVGSTMVRGAFRPAYRLTLVGVGFLAVELLINVFSVQPPGWLTRFLDNVIGPVLFVLGGVCLFVLGFGWWLKRLAGQATFFYERTVHAQFLALTEATKGRHVARDAALFDRRVFAPEELARGRPDSGGSEARRRAFCEAMHSWLVRSRAGSELAGVDDAMERTILLYRDSMDGAPFTDSDDRTTSQLLGSPALRQMRALSRRVDTAEAGRIQALDLSRPRSSIRGPYLWFSFIAKAMAQATARLVVEYNRYAIPLDELPFSSEAERLRYEAWVATGKPPAGERGREKLHLQRRGYITTAFTALHFLDDEPGRDRDVETRFGPRVLANLRRDRRMLFRESFGTYPLHTRSKDQRVLNLYRLYERWFAGGRAFLVPLRLLWRWLCMIGRFGVWLGRAVAEIRTPRMRGDADVASEADFATAARKIGRVRDPVAWASLWLRARFDAEYLGVQIPGARSTGIEGAAWEEDLHFLEARGTQRRRLERERARAEADVRRLARCVEEGLLEQVAAVIGVALADLGREHMRAATVAYRGDFRSVRTLLSCQAILEETLAGVFDRAPPAPSLRPRPRLRRWLRRWWRVHGRPSKPARRLFWRAVVRDVDGAGAALRAWGLHGRERARALGLERLADLLRHPGRISEQLVTLRTVQTLALIDLLNDREHVYRLGGYAASGDAPGPSLDADQAIERPPSTGNV